MPGELIKFTPSLNEEEQRHIREQLTEVELVTERSELRLGKPFRKLKGCRTVRSPLHCR